MNRRLQRLACSGVFWFSAICGATSLSLPAHTPVPGGIALVPLPVASSRVSASYQGRRVLVRQGPQGAVAVVGIALSTPPGAHEVRYGDNSEKTVSFTVVPRDYPEQRITLADRAMVTPDEAQLQRIRREQRQMREAYATYSENLTAELEFQLPLSGPVSSVFGLRRYFNDQPRSPHSGIDLAAPRGSPVIAPAAARVIQTGDFYFNGKTVLLDHGEGLVTMYCHLDSITVTPEQMVATGDTIGVVGSTGRATGPHLHWSVSLNAARIDPTLLLGDQLARDPD